LGLSRAEGLRRGGVRAVEREGECESGQEKGEGRGHDRNLASERDSSASRWCVVCDARHAYKTPVRVCLFRGKAAGRAGEGEAELGCWRGF